MSAIHSGNLSSLRKFAKRDVFYTFVGQKRLRHIQDLCADPMEPNEQKVDAILCVLGIDSRYNEGCQELANYLFFGFFDSLSHNINEMGIEESAVEDFMILIRHRQVDVFCNPIGYPFLLPYFAAWKNLHVHCLKLQNFKGVDESEDFKIESFLAMVSGSECIGIPYSSTSRKQEFDKMVVERWPIIQSHAANDVGGGTFFTLKYEVVDVSDVINFIYQEVDAANFEELVVKHLGHLERQCSAFVQIVDSKRARAHQMSGKELAEPLVTYFKHGISSNKDISNIRQPFVLLGKQTRRVKLEASMVTGASSDDVMSPDNNTATHMICYVMSPESVISCCRTYFFSSGVPCCLSNYINDTVTPNDVELLSSIYVCCVKAVGAAIESYREKHDKDAAETSAKQVLCETWENMGLRVGLGHLSNKDNVFIAVESFDESNRELSFSRWTYGQPKTATVRVYDIPSIELRGQSIGSVAYSDTFVDSVIPVKGSDGTVNTDSECFVLTENIPKFVMWPVENRDRLAFEYVEEILKNVQLKVESKEDIRKLNRHSSPQKEWGRCLVKGEKVYVFVEDGSLIATGKLLIMEGAIFFYDQHLGAVSLPLQELTSVHLYDGDSPSTVNVLTVSYKEHMAAYIPPPLRSDRNHMLFAIEPKSKAAMQFIYNVLPYWNELEHSPLIRLEELPEELTAVHQRLQDQFNLRLKPAGNTSQLKKLMADMPRLKSFFSHLEASTTVNKPVPKKHLPIVIGRESDMGSFTATDDLIVTILSGIPGSHKENLSKTLLNLAKLDSRWALLRLSPTDAAEQFNAKQLQHNLTQTWKSLRTQESSLAMRAFIISPGFTDTVSIVQAIASHPDKQVARNITIGAVTVCLDPRNVYMKEMYALPKVFDQCAYGWVNTIIFTSCTQAVGGNIDPILDEVQATIRLMNPNVAFILAEKGVITRSSEVDLILSGTAFNSDDMVRARYLSCPGWSDGLYNPGEINPMMNEVMLTFTQPLDRNRFTSRLKRAKLNLRLFPFDGNIYLIRGQVGFANDGKLYDLSAAILNESLSLEVMEAKDSKPYFLIFTGVQMEENSLQTWLRNCAPSHPEKRVVRVRSSLTKTEIARIHKAHHLDALPDGWFYNGCQYVSLAGDRQDTHPLLEKFLKDYLNEVNHKTLTYNADIDSKGYKDMFD